MDKISGILLVLLIMLFGRNTSYAQEYLVPVSSIVRFACSVQDSSNQHILYAGGAKQTDSSLMLPFFDDFSNYEGRPCSMYWQTSDAYVNKDFGPLPPTIGVATLDAVDGTGRLHANAAASYFGGDTLTSRPIRLDSAFVPQRRALQASDSIYITFYWLPGGGYGDMWARIGDAPEPVDSLILEFYSAQQQKWQRAWSVAGIEVDSLIAHTGTAWQWAAVPVNNEKWLNSQFQFRFRNLCSLDPGSKTGMVGNCDQWNLDYVRLDYGRSRRDSITRDVAFVSKAPSMLSLYYAMPVTQYSPGEMAAQVALDITNRYSQTLSAHYRYRVLDDAGNQVAQYDGGSDNLVPYCEGHHYQTVAAHATPPVNFSYAITRVPQTFTVEHVVSEGIAGDVYPQNDTIRFRQVFDNYFAYDDGVPENGYGLTSTSSRMYMAVRFVLTRRDTLTALDLFFNRTRNDENVGMAFTLSVWRNKDGKPGEQVYRDGNGSRVRGDGLEAYCRYPLAQPVLLEPDTYYIGFEQASKNYINIGFDRSRDICGQNYYRTASEWQQSILNGAILLRPCFGKRATVGIRQPETQHAPLAATLFPNPASTLLSIRLDDNLCADAITTEIRDMQGNVLLRRPYAETVDVSSLPSGLYLLCLTDKESGRRSMHKLLLAK